MATNALPDAFIAGATYYLLQLVKPPLKAVLAGILPADQAWQDNGLRAVGFAITYGLLVANGAAVGLMTWPAAWALLPVAAGVYGGSLLLYHIGGATGAAATSAPPDSPDRRVLSVPAEAQVSVLVPPRPVRERDVAPPPAGAVPAPPSPATPATGTQGVPPE